ncbi:MAG TPA: ATPase, T2SS/T4P/T4SS family, partial [Rhodocyclaceae bacterium]
MNAPESGDVAARLLFLKKLQSVTNKIHSTTNVDEIMLELSQDICELFNADRLTVYVMAEEKTSIISKVKTGLNSFRDIKLPVSDMSVAGYVAQNRKLVNIKDVYDDAELKRYSPRMQFLKEVDKRTGYRSKQMLACPIEDAGTSELLGVLQLINHKIDAPFPPMIVEGVQEIAKTLAVAFMQRQKQPRTRTRYDALITEAVISAADMDMAQRTARRKDLGLEEVLVREFDVRPPVIGDALSKYFNVPYEPFKADRVKPIDLLRNLKRDYVEANQWVPLEETAEGIVVLSPDPERLQTSRVANNVYPRSKIVYRVTTQQEFVKTLEQYFGALADLGSVTDILSDMDDGDHVDAVAADEVDAAADNELVRLVNKVIIDAHQQGASDIHVEPRPGKEKTVIRFRKDGTLVPYIEIPASFRNPLVARLKIMCDLDISEKRRPQDGKIKFKKYGPLDIELRVATLPTAGGLEDVVMRILAGGEPIPLDQLGLSPNNRDNLLKCVEKPYGLFFVCGPTGSGKTTTLHSILGHLNKPETKIW